MICDPCREQVHNRCIDVGHQRQSTACFCQHKTSKKAEPATGPAGE